MDPFEIDVINQQSAWSVDTHALETAIRAALKVERVARAVISVSIVDNAAIHRLNRDHLAHDYPTDVISFQLDFDGASADSVLRAQRAAIEGEVVVSVEMAAQVAPAHGWSMDHELTLYVLHGLLHVCGYDDLTDDEATLMRLRERAALAACGIDIPVAMAPLANEPLTE